MVTHSSDMQDLSQHTIPRHLQDTALPVSPCHYSSIPQCITPESSVSCPINADGLLTAYMHHYCCMAAHSLDMQDPLPHTITRPLQDTALPLSPYHHSYILRGTTPDSSLSHHSNTDGLVTAYRHHYCNTGTAPSRRQATEHDTDPISLIPRH
jgi:hypothetical protein